MDSIICSYCQCTLESYRLLLHHIGNYHKSTRNFRCFVQKCNRTFSSYKSLRNHICQKHDSVVDVKNEEVESVPISDENYCENTNIPQEVLTSDVNFESSDESDESIIYDSSEEHDFKDMYTIPLFSEPLKNITVKYCASISNLRTIPRKYVTDIIHETKNFLNEIFELLKISELDNVNTNKLNKDQLIDNFANCLNIVDTEQKRFSLFKTLETYIAPVSYNIGERIEYRKVNSVQTLVHVPVNAQFIPVRNVFKAFFELPNVFDDTMQYIRVLESNNEIISNIIQGQYWKERMKTFKGKKVMPLIMYHDDYGNNNVIGTHKGLSKSGGVYLNIPVLPPEYQSKVENIFLFILFNTLDRQVFKNPIIFSRAVEELNFLYETGIDIELPDRHEKIYFELILFIGDNLGVHSIGGLTESFKSTVFCQHCLVTQSEKNTVFREEDCDLRTVDNYDELVALNDSKVTGIKETSVLNKINNFHIVQNIAVDVMHDLLEGICRYDAAFLLHEFIYVNKFFTLETLNARLRGFDFGHGHNINIPPELNEKSIKNGCIILTSSEMLYLIQNLNLIIGDLVPKNNEHWQMYLFLKEIVTVVSSNTIHPLTYQALETLIFEYLTLLTSLANYFKPKHHFLVHYPRSMKRFGPLWKISCLRYESKNQEGKVVSKNTSSRVNINKTIAIKNQLQLNYRFITKKTRKPVFHSTNHKRRPLSGLQDYHEYHHLITELNSTISSVKIVYYYDKVITKNCILMKCSSSAPIFQLIHEIIFVDSKHIFITKNLTDCFYDEHMQAFKIYDMNQFNWDRVEEKDICKRHLLHFVLLPDGYNYISKVWM